VQLLNTAVWLRRSSFNRKWHFIHWNIGNLCLFLTLPLLRCNQKSQMILFSNFMSVTAQISIFAYIAALTPLHGIIAIFVVVVIQIGIFCSQFASPGFSYYDGFIVINKVLIPTLLVLVLGFLAGLKELSAKKRIKTNKPVPTSSIVIEETDKSVI